jgi:hypothetical protein
MIVEIGKIFIVKVVSFMGTSLNHILFPHPRGKIRTSAQTKVTYPPILGSGSSNMLECFWILIIISSKFLPAGTSNFFWAMEGRNDNFFLENSHMLLAKKRAGIHF